MSLTTGGVPIPIGAVGLGCVGVLSVKIAVRMNEPTVVCFLASALGDLLSGASACDSVFVVCNVIDKSPEGL
jgi:hypothetical protein